MDVVDFSSPDDDDDVVAKESNDDDSNFVYVPWDDDASNRL